MAKANTSTTVNEIFQKLIANNFSELDGLAVDASIPVPQHMINEIIEAALQGNQNIESCRVSIGEQNRISVNVKTTPLAVALKFEALDFQVSGSYTFSKDQGFAGK